MAKTASDQTGLQPYFLTLNLQTLWLRYYARFIIVDCPLSCHDERVGFQKGKGGKVATTRPKLRVNRQDYSHISSLSTCRLNGFRYYARFITVDRPLSRHDERVGFQKGKEGKVATTRILAHNLVPTWYKIFPFFALPTLIFVIA